MYDELVKRLREAPNDWPDADLHYEAADAIEELRLVLSAHTAATHKDHLIRNRNTAGPMRPRRLSNEDRNRNDRHAGLPGGPAAGGAGEVGVVEAERSGRWRGSGDGRRLRRGPSFRGADKRDRAGKRRHFHREGLRTGHRKVLAGVG